MLIESFISLIASAEVEIRHYKFNMKFNFAANRKQIELLFILLSFSYHFFKKSILNSIDVKLEK